MPNVHHSTDWYANSDIDWFCRINGINIHVASMGRQIPTRVAETLPVLYEQVSEIEMAEWHGTESVWYNEELLREWLRIEEPLRMARYLYSFVVMARKGFYSFAPVTPDLTDDNYYLMAKPVVYEDRVLNGIVNKDYDLDIEGVGPFTALPLMQIIERIQ